MSGREKKEKTLFGDEDVFDTQKDVSQCRQVINADYSCWKDFLMINLRYAEAIRKARMPEISAWREVLNKVGIAGTYTAEAEFGDTGDDFAIEQLAGDSLFIHGKEKEFFEKRALSLSIRCNSEAVYYPYCIDRKLVYLREDKAGTLRFPFDVGFFAGKRFRDVFFYDENDLPELLKGAYKLFARDRRALPKIMNMFLQQQS